MKKIFACLAALFLVFASTNVHAQSKTGQEYFAGKWSVVIKNTPQGDAKMIFVLEKKDSTLTGVVQDSTGTEISKISQVQVKDNNLTLNFEASGYDLNLVMDKKDEDHIIGTLMGMFDAEGERIKARLQVVNNN